MIEVRGFGVTPQLIGLAGALAKPNTHESQALRVQGVKS